MELDMKKSTDPKTLTFGVWSLKTSLGQFGPKAFGRGLIKSLHISQDTWLQFSQTGPHFFKNYEMNLIKLKNLKKYLDLGAWGLETKFGPLGPGRHIQP